MNNLKDLNLKKSYDPSVDGSDVINDFYIPCLSSSIQYDRCSAYFSSAVLKQISKGLVNFYKNGGHARFIFSCEIMDDEMSTIMKAYDEKMDSLALSLDQTLENDYEIANLSYLIKHNMADVKIAFMIKSKSALMHIKSGLFIDKLGNKVYFDGSGNETEAGILKNAEIFNVFNNFSGYSDYLEIGENRFNQLWNNTYSPSTIRTEFPTGDLFKKLISYSRDKVFKSEEEFFYNEDCVYVDINIDEHFILLKDYTSNCILNYPQVLKSKYKSMKEVGPTIWSIEELKLHDLRDQIPYLLKKYGKKVVYSKNALEYMAIQDLKIDKRVKLAESIKTHQNYDLWQSDFVKFKLTISNEIVAQLKERQLENAYHHYAMKSSMDFSVPGTGKTYISYGLFAYLYSSFNKEQNVNHLVVFGPLNCFKAWRDECYNIFGFKHDFTFFDITEHHYDFEVVLKSNKFHIYLFNYEFVNETKTDVLSKYVIDDKTLLVFDEIHKLKSIAGVRANSIIQMIEKCNRKPVYKLALTGTPLPNSYLDLYNYLKILYADDLNGFLNAFSENQLKQADNNLYFSKQIQDNLHPLFMRTTKQDLNIPAANVDDIETLCVAPSTEEVELFSLIHKSYKNPLLKFIRLIQAASNPRLILDKINIDDFKYLYDDYSLVSTINSEFTDDESVYLDQEIELIQKIGVSTKMKRTLEFIKDNASKARKMIIWCLFINTIDYVKNELERLGLNCITITGRDDIKVREARIDEFKFGDVEVLITNPNTLAESVSLHHECHDAIYLEFGFNLTYLLQSKDRIHRVGLKEGTQTNYYFSLTNCNDSFSAIDFKIYNRLQEKANRMRETIESNNLTLYNDTSDIEDIKLILGE